MSRTSLSVFFGLMLCLPVQGAAQPPPVRGWFLRNQVAARVNPLGLFDEARLGYRAQLFHSSSSILDNNYVAVSGNASVSPAFARGGVSFELQPLSFLNLSVIYEGGGYFGTFGLAQSFPSAASASFSDDEIWRRGALPDGDPMRAYATPMHQLILGASVQGRLGPVLARSNNRFVFQGIGIRPGDIVLYDQNWDILFPNGGWIYVNDVDVLVEATSGLLIGARYNVTHAFYRAGDFAPGELGTGSPNETTHRLGILGSYTFFNSPERGFNAPTLALVVNWWLAHPYRTRGDAAAIPYVGLAFSFRWDL